MLQMFTIFGRLAH